MVEAVDLPCVSECVGKMIQKENATLETLHLRTYDNFVWIENDKLGNQGIVEIAASLKDNTSLLELDISMDIIHMA